MTPRIPQPAAGVFVCANPGRPSENLNPYGRFLCLVLLVLALAGPVSAQSVVGVSGYVYDAVDGYPLGQAEVVIPGTEYRAVTDEYGFYALANIPAGRYLLRAEADGFQPEESGEMSIVVDVTRRIDFHLQRSLYDLGKVEVRGRREQLPTADLVAVDRRQIIESQAVDLADVLKRMEGVYVTESGPSGGQVRVSIRGCAPKHVLVLLDGQRINSAATGEADLSVIPLDAVERIEVSRGGASARYGADALGGIVNIITQVQKAATLPEMASRKYWGAWKTDRRQLSLVDFLPVEGLTTKFAYGYRSSNGDFEYRYRVSPEPDASTVYEGIRANAESESDDYFISGRYRAGEMTWLGFSGQVYDSRQGLPGKVSRPDTAAWKEDRRKMGTVRIEHGEPGSVYKVDISAGFSRFEQYFNNIENPNIAPPYETRYINDIFRIDIAGRYRLPAGNEVSGGGQWQRDILYHDDLLAPSRSLGRAVRDNAGVYISDRQVFDLAFLPVLRMAAVDVSLRYDNTDTRHDEGAGAETAVVIPSDQWSHKTGVSFSAGETVRLVVRGSYGKSYRLPSMNALFWKGDIAADANPDLRPERAEHSDAGWELSYDGWADVSVGMTYFHTYVKDQIVWRPGSPGGWKPVNLEAVRSTGHEDFVDLRLFDDHVRFAYHNTVTVPKNRTPGANSYGKDLMYTPRYVTSLEGAVRVWKFRGGYTIRLVDKRYNKEANTKYYDAYRVDDISLGFCTSVSRLTVESIYRVNNINDEDYVLIGHYPMPGREWGWEISLAYKI